MFNYIEHTVEYTVLLPVGIVEVITVKTNLLKLAWGGKSKNVQSRIFMIFLINKIIESYQISSTIFLLI